MNRNTLKLHRGTDNTVLFRVHDLDRKPADTQHMQVVAQMVNPQNGETVLRKLVRATDRRGRLQMQVTEAELQRVPPGLYNLTVQGEQELIPDTDGEVYRTPLYTDVAHNTVLTVEVMPSADPGPVPSAVITSDQWRLVQSGKGLIDDIEEYRTSAVPGTQVRNHINALHTLAVFATNFTGSLQVLATLDLQPPEDLRRWFPVDLTTGTNIIEFSDYSDSISFTFTANFTWLTFVKRPNWFPEYSAFEVVEPNTGTIDKIILR